MNDTEKVLRKKLVRELNLQDLKQTTLKNNLPKSYLFLQDILVN